jgi:hypothetical protein
LRFDRLRARFGGLGGKTEVHAEFVRHILIDRAGMGLLLTDPKLGERFQNQVRLDLQLPSQLINSNFLHTLYNFTRAAT